MDYFEGRQGITHEYHNFDGFAEETCYDSKESTIETSKVYFSPNSTSSMASVYDIEPGKEMRLLLLEVQLKSIYCNRNRNSSELIEITELLL